MYMYIHPRIILGWSVYPRNPRILGQGACCKENYMYMYMYIHTGIILGYPRNPRILRQGACCKENYMCIHVHSSRDYPGMVCVSQESQDTQTRGMLQGELHVYTCTFIPGLSWDGLCIPGYSDKGMVWLCLIGQVKFIPGLSRDHILFILAVVLIPYVPKEIPS